MSTIIRGNLLNFIVTMTFMFSTIYGLMYLYNIGAGQENQVNGLDEMDPGNPVKPNSPWWTSILSVSFDTVFEVVSLFNPFILVKGLLFIVLPDMFYTFVNLFLLRPIGVIVTFMEIDYIANMIRGKSE